jgi:hypothetical protein
MQADNLNRRARRTAATMERGLELWKFFQEPEIAQKLIDRAEADSPSVGGVSADLMARFGDVLRDPAARRKMGVFIAATMASHGYEVAQAKVRLKDPVFTSGAVYKKRHSAAAAPAELLARIAGSLTRSEAVELIQLLKHLHPGLRA